MYEPPFNFCTGTTTRNQVHHLKSILNFRLYDRAMIQPIRVNDKGIEIQMLQ